MGKRIMVEKMEFSKKLLVWLFLWANIILTLSVFFVIRNNDSETLRVLISVVGLEVIAGIVWYMKKSQEENKVKIAKGGENYEYDQEDHSQI